MRTMRRSLAAVILLLALGASAEAQQVVVSTVATLSPAQRQANVPIEVQAARSQIPVLNEGEYLHLRIDISDADAANPETKFTFFLLEMGGDGIWRRFVGGEWTGGPEIDEMTGVQRRPWIEVHPSQFRPDTTHFKIVFTPWQRIRAGASALIVTYP